MASSEYKVLICKSLAKSWYNTTTNTKAEEVSFRWTIWNFLDCLITEPGKYIKSAVFHMNDDNNTSWRLKLYPKGCNEVYADYVSLTALLDTNDDGRVSAEHKYYILDRSEKKRNVMKDTILFIKGTGWRASKFIEREILTNQSDDLLPYGNLTICCDIRIKGGPETSRMLFSNQPDFDSSKRSFGDFFNKSLFSDITFDIKGKEIFAHKIILSTCSPKFFGAICSKENDQNRVEVANVPYEVMEDILRYIYTGKEPSFKDPPYDLLHAAKSYDLEELRKICEERLASIRPS